MRARHSALRIFVCLFAFVLTAAPGGTAMAADASDAVDLFQRGRATFSLEIPAAMPDTEELEPYDLGLSFSRYADPMILGLYFTFRPDLGDVVGDFTAVDRQVRQAGWQRTYLFGLGTYRTTAVDQYAWAMLHVTEADSEESAQEIYRVVSDAGYNAQQGFDYITIDGAEEAVLFTTSGVDESFGSRFELGLSLAAIGKYVIGVAATAYEGYGLDPSVFTSLPEMAIERLVAPAPYTGQPGLSWSIPRVQDGEYFTDDDGYTRIDNREQRAVFDEAADVVDADAFWEGIGVSNSYEYITSVSDSEAEIGFSDRIVLFLYDFDSVNQAAEAFSAWSQFMAEGGYDRMSGVRSEDLLTDLGPDVVSYSYTMTFSEGEVVDGYYMLMRTGDKVMEIYVDSPTTAKRAVAEIFGRAAFECQSSATICPEITSLSTMSG